MDSNVMVVGFGFSNRAIKSFCSSSEKRASKSSVSPRCLIAPYPVAKKLTTVGRKDYPYYHQSVFEYSNFSSLFTIGESDRLNHSKYPWIRQMGSGRCVRIALSVGASLGSGKSSSKLRNSGSPESIHSNGETKLGNNNGTGDGFSARRAIIAPSKSFSLYGV